MNGSGSYEVEVLEGLSQLSSDDERESFFESRPELIKLWQVERLNAEVLRMIRVDPESAHAVALTTRWLAHRVAAPQGLALSARSLANSHHFLLQCRRAQVLYDEADDFVSAEGEVDGAVYGHVLRPRATDGPSA